MSQLTLFDLSTRVNHPMDDQVVCRLVLQGIYPFYALGRFKYFHSTTGKIIGTRNGINFERNFGRTIKYIPDQDLSAQQREACKKYNLVNSLPNFQDPPPPPPAKDSFEPPQWWLDLRTRFPEIMDFLSKWIDAYKKAVDWQNIFKAGIKFHDTPTEMQLGVLKAFCDEMGQYQAGLSEDFNEFTSELNALFAGPERACRKCGCTDDNCQQCIERTGQPCLWVEEDLCSACAPAAQSILLPGRDF